MGRFRDNHHIVEAYAWVVLTVPALLWWKDSILFVILVSLYANFKTAISAHEARLGRREAASSAEGDGATPLGAPRTPRR